MKTQKAWRVLVGMFLVALMATAVFAIDVKTDYDRTANFSNYKTYSWEKDADAGPVVG